MISSPKFLLIAGASALALLATGCSKTEQAGLSASPPPTTVGMEVDDSVVTVAVKSALLAEPALKSLDVQVETRKGEVMLSGFVNDPNQVALALAATRKVDGVKAVDNKLILKVGDATVGNKIDDTVVTTRVKSAFLQDGDVKGMDIAVVTRKGEVMLSGFVDNPDQVARAVKVAQAVDGVQSVRNDLAIKK